MERELTIHELAIERLSKFKGEHLISEERKVVIQKLLLNGFSAQQITELFGYSSIMVQEAQNQPQNQSKMTISQKTDQQTSQRSQAPCSKTKIKRQLNQVHATAH